VQEIPVKWAKRFREFFVATLAINVITNHRVSDCTQMDSNLMRPACFYRYIEQRKVPEMLHNVVPGVRCPPPNVSGCHLCPNRRMTSNRHLEHSIGFSRPTVNKRGVILLNLPIREGTAEPCMRYIVFRDDQQSVFFFIEPMNDAGSAVATDVGEGLKMKKQSVHDSFCVRAGPGMDHESCRLLNDRQIPVFEVNLERDLLWCHWRRFQSAKIDFDGLSTSKAIAGFIFPTGNTNRAGAI